MKTLSHSPWLAAGLLTLGTLFWAGNALVAKGLAETVAPVTLAFLRWSMASVVLLPFAWPHLKRDWRTLVREWPIMVLLSLVGISSYNTILYHAAHTTTATHIALIQTVMPALIVLLSLAIYKETAGPRQVGGVILAIAGAVVIVLHGEFRRLLELDFVAGDLWMLLAALIYAYYSVRLRSAPHVHPLAFLAATFVIGSAGLLPLFLWEAAETPLPPLDAELVLAVAYVAIFPSILSYRFWNRGVAVLGANRAGLFICLVPVFTSALAVAFLDERLHLYHGAGLLLIAGGFVLFNLTRPPP